jgi:ribonuclease VapC
MNAAISVLDTSAILALILAEPRGQMLTPAILRSSTASTVNLAEVHAKLVRDSWRPENAWADTLAWIVSVEPFALDHAKLAGSLIAQTKPFGLSLGDRACLALALALSAPVYTTDRAWANLNLGIPIHVLR